MSGAPNVAFQQFRFQWEEIRDDVLAAVERVGQSGWYILGKEVERFEGLFSRHCGAEHVVGCGNGLDAIEIGLRCLGARPGERVITTPLSAFATTLAISRAGCTPVFVDTDSNGLIDLNLVEEAAKKTSAKFLVPVHLYGFPLDLARLHEVAQRAKLRVVEDCAQAVGAKFGGKPVGSVGEVAAISFYPTKNLGCLGDGGALFTQVRAHARTARQLRDYGQSSKYSHEALGLNSRLDELQAAILSDALLPRLADFTARRAAVARRYLEGIRHPRLTLPKLDRPAEPVWHLFPVLVEGDRASFESHLAAAGVASARHYPHLIPDQGAMKSLSGSQIAGPLTRADRFARQEVSLPIHPFLTKEEVERVIEGCTSWEK